jgi:hypothetical protein
MSADKTTDAVKLNLRLPKRLHRRLVQQAKGNNVSLNTEIINQLEGAEAAAATAAANRTLEVVRPIRDQLTAVESVLQEHSRVLKEWFVRAQAAASDDASPEKAPVEDK